MRNKDFGEIKEQYENMIWQMVHRYHIPYVTEKEELYQMGLFGLWRAQEKFDEGKGVKFTTYAHHNISGWVRNAVQKAMEVGVSRDDLKKIKDFKENPDKKVNAKDINLLFYSEGLLSLDRKNPAHDDNGENFDNLVPSDEDVENTVLMRRVIEERMVGLTDLERSILLLKHAVGYKNKEIQEILNISHTYLWMKNKDAILKFKKYS